MTQTKERPILFSAPMVLAILDGHKTQTRRVVKLPKKWASRFPICAPHHMKADHEVWWHGPDTERVGVAQSCPYGQPGDHLWVRECFSRHLYDGGVWYWADGNIADDDCEKPRPSIHMPRWASRITLEITDIRVERLQDITKDDIYAEGAITDEWMEWREDVANIGMPSGSTIMSERDVWERLWNSINGLKYPWDTNPWVWVVEFERMK